MTLTVDEVEQALMALDPSDRAAVIRRVSRSLDEDDEPVDQDELNAAWNAEFRRRIDEIESGAVQLLDVDESHAQLRAQLADRRRERLAGSAGEADGGQAHEGGDGAGGHGTHERGA